MNTMPSAATMTADEFLALQRTDDRWYELVEGELVVNEPQPLHNETQQRVIFAIRAWVQAERGRGTVWLPIDTVLDTGNVFSPDVVWFAEGRGPGVHDQSPVALPDLAVEVRSPSTWRRDLFVKQRVYERSGLPELWLVDTKGQEVFVFRHDAPPSSVVPGGQLTSPLLPGFSLDIAALFTYE
jgi:Uma2 family endonuclease